MAAMGVRRYSRDPAVKRQQELVDHLQWRCGIDYYAPSIGELIAANVLTVELQCRDYACLHRSEPVDLRAYPPKLRTHRLRLKFVCSKCGRKRPQLNLQWHGRGGEDGLAALLRRP